MTLVGRPIPRVEDPRFLRGASEYLDDIAAVDALHVAMIRSPYAHARVNAIDATGAEGAPGVVAVITADTLGAANGPFPHPTWFPAGPVLARAIEPTLNPATIQLLASDRVRFVGEAVAVVVARDRYLAEDAARLVEVDFEPLEVLADPEHSLDADAPLLEPGWGTNLAAHFTVTKASYSGAAAAAAVTVRQRYRVPRQTGTPMEARGVLARPERRSGGVTVWSSTQTPHWLRDALVRSLSLAGDQIRVASPDVGGGFGVKSMVYPEELLIPWLAIRLGREVKWIDTRRENFLTAIHSRSQLHDVELALSADGTILGLRDAYLIDAGASNVEALIVPYNTAAHLQGPYRIPALELKCTVVLTNKSPLSAYRGAGRPEAVFAMERILDLAATRLGMDPIELRRRNTLTAAEMPYDAGILYRDGAQLVLDGGDYRACLDRAVIEIDLEDFRQRQAAAREAGSGKRLGFGVAGYVEGTGVGPFEGARVAIEPSGSAVVTVALPSQGQGHETVLAQIAGDLLGLSMDKVHVIQGDTLALPEGGGTIASRTAVVVGSAVFQAATKLRERTLRLAADALEASVADLSLSDGAVRVAGSPDRFVTIGHLARSVSPGSGRQARDGEGPLRAEATFQPSTVTFANGIHAAIVELDEETGLVRILRYVVVHDCGKVINPLIVDGQVRGGVAQGIGGALTEELIYDDNGQLLTGTFMDYGVPRSPDVPPIEVVHLETPSQRNPLGIKGVGEAGTIAVAPAIAGAIEDALQRRVHPTTYPFTPETVLALVREAAAMAQQEGALRES